MSGADRFGASDAWTMFLLWACAEGRLLAAVVAFAILTMYCFAFGSSKPLAGEKEGGK